MKRIVNLVGPIAVMALAVPGICRINKGEEEDVRMARTLVEAFLKEDFENLDAKKDVRFGKSKYPASYLALEKKDGPTGVQRRVARPVDIPYFFLVGSFEISDVSLEKDKGKVLVSYNALAKGRYDRQKERFHFTREAQTHVDQTISLVKVKGKWFVSNPPIPRISAHRFREQLVEKIATQEEILGREAEELRQGKISKESYAIREQWIMNFKADLQELDQAVGARSMKGEGS